MKDVKSIPREKGQRQQVNLTDKKEDVTCMSGVKGMKWGKEGKQQPLEIRDNEFTQGLKSYRRINPAWQRRPKWRKNKSLS